MLFSATTSGQFKTGDRVVFIGNSITHAGDYHHNLLYFNLAKNNKATISYFNAGVSGDVTGGILKRLSTDILVHKPTHCIIMIGMNDVQRQLYKSTPTNNIDTIKQQEEAIQIYKTNLRKIVDTLLRKKIVVSLQTPSIYDQTAELKTANGLGINDALKKCADFIKELALEKNLKVIDYWEVMNNLNIELQKTNKSATVVSQDRVHPGAMGHFVMSSTFLKAYNALTIGQNKTILTKNIITQTKNTQVKNIRLLGNNMSFDYYTPSLPLVLEEPQQLAASHLHIAEDLNVETLIIKQLAEGIYIIKIDGKNIDTVSAEDFTKGINLFDYKESTWYSQSEEVKKALATYWLQEANIRTITWAEFSHLEGFKNTQDIFATKAYLDKRFEENFKTSPFGNYIRGQYDTYLLLKPLEADIKEKYNFLRIIAVKKAKPTWHKIEIMKLN
jgi:lysophospholipase L1-like esterase